MLHNISFQISEAKFSNKKKQTKQNYNKGWKNKTFLNLPKIWKVETKFSPLALEKFLKEGCLYERPSLNFQQRIIF